METLTLRFFKWGAGFLVLGVVTGFLPLAHYLMAGADPSCPAAPVHGHAVLLGWVGMTLFALVYRALPIAAEDLRSLRWARIHFWLAVVGVLGEWANGTVGYEILNYLHPGFYYQPEMPVLQVWFGISGLFLTVYGVGCVLFLRIVLRSKGT